MKAFERRFFQAWNEGKPEILDELYSPAFIDHFNGENLDAAKQGIIRVRAAFSDFHLTLDDQIAGGISLYPAGPRAAYTVATFLAFPPPGSMWKCPASGSSGLRTGRSSKRGRSLISSACSDKWEH